MRLAAGQCSQRECGLLAESMQPRKCSSVRAWLRAVHPSTLRRLVRIRGGLYARWQTCCRASAVGYQVSLDAHSSRARPRTHMAELSTAVVVGSLCDRYVVIKSTKRATAEGRQLPACSARSSRSAFDGGATLALIVDATKTVDAWVKALRTRSGCATARWRRSSSVRGPVPFAPARSRRSPASRLANLPHRSPRGRV